MNLLARLHSSSNYFQNVEQLSTMNTGPSRYQIDYSKPDHSRLTWYVAAAIFFCSSFVGGGIVEVTSIYVLNMGDFRMGRDMCFLLSLVAVTIMSIVESASFILSATIFRHRIPVGITWLTAAGATVGAIVFVPEKIIN